MSEEAVASRCVDASQVEYLTAQGWCLVQVVPATKVVDAHKEHPPGFSQPQQVREFHVVSQPIFVLERPLAQVQQKAQDDAQIYNLQAELRVVQQELAVQVKARIAAEQLANTRENDFKSRHQDYERERDLRMKVEKDLAKVRDAIGSERFQQLVGGPVPTPR